MLFMNIVTLLVKEAHTSEFGTWSVYKASQLFVADVVAAIACMHINVCMHV
jgi:hypothetical protein